MERREMMKVLATLPLAGWALSHAEIADAAEFTNALDEHDPPQQHVPTQQPPQVREPAVNYKATFFTALEWRTVKTLVDIVIPRDAKSGSASEARVPEFMDFVMKEYPNNQARMRDGLGWLNAESRTRFGVPFPDAKKAEQIQIVEDIAWPAKAKPQHVAGARFFSSFRDLTASGFFTSRMGVKDIGYRGNIPQASWSGCPATAEKHIGVS
jgi:gluconate 2-dehydrogenase gamma chain